LQVFSIKTYYAGTDSKELEHVIKNLQRWSPERKPIWTALSVASLAFPEMKIEIDAVAYAPKADK
jgi:enamine deaminase RidA (YjgF/YER057c/UK114 family)